MTDNMVHSDASASITAEGQSGGGSSSHTPGPFVTFPTDGGVHILGPGNELLATVHAYYEMLNRNVANANLFAAAPDLLDAAKEQHRALDWLMARLIELDPGFMPSKSPAWQAVTMGHAAIAKATGAAA